MGKGSGRLRQRVWVRLHQLAGLRHSLRSNKRSRELLADDTFYEFLGYCFYCGFEVYDGWEVVDWYHGEPVLYHHDCYDDEIVLGV